MALVLAVVATLLAMTSAMSRDDMSEMLMSGSRHNMQMQQQQQMMMMMGKGGCQEGQSGGCDMPMGNNMQDMQEYMERMEREQQYETQQMTERVKAHFQEMMKQVTDKKHRYVMGLTTEFVSTCECGRSSEEIYRALFFEQAKTLNLTQPMDEYDYYRPAYEAKSEEEARFLIFSGLLKNMCESGMTFLSFADQVNQRVLAIQAGKK